MSGKSITKEQVKLYMSHRKQINQTQASAAAKAGFSERSARRIDAKKNLIDTALPRQYKTRKDPLNGAFEKHLVPLLELEPKLQPITLLEVLDELEPGKFDDSHLRTLQRRVKRWRAHEGAEKEVIFQQEHIPGDMGISDYTWANELNITISGEVFQHKLYHYRLVYSGWTYVQVILGGESFESLSAGLQNALWQSGGVPATHRTDSLSAAFNNHYEQEKLTERYEKLCQYYDLKATRNNKGIAHENGAIESPNGHLKRKIEQKLLLRSSRDFSSLVDYEGFIDEIIRKINKRCKTRFNEEKTHLKPLPSRRTHDFSECYVSVTTRSTISVKRVTYTVPSRLIGNTLLVHIYNERLDLFYGHELTLTLTRVYAHRHIRSRSINYKHIIHSLAKKPNAFKSSVYRDDIVPDGDFTLIWKHLKQTGIHDDECHYMVSLLSIADTYDCEESLGRYVLTSLEAGKRASIEQCRDIFASISIEIPQNMTQQHKLTSYDALLRS
jgi:hypothetical protein